MIHHASRVQLDVWLQANMASRWRWRRGLRCKSAAKPRFLPLYHSRFLGVVSYCGNLGGLVNLMTSQRISIDGSYTGSHHSAQMGIHCFSDDKPRVERCPRKGDNNQWITGSQQLADFLSSKYHVSHIHHWTSMDINGLGRRNRIATGHRPYWDLSTLPRGLWSIDYGSTFQTIMFRVNMLSSICGRGNGQVIVTAVSPEKQPAQS